MTVGSWYVGHQDSSDMEGQWVQCDYSVREEHSGTLACASSHCLGVGQKGQECLCSEYGWQWIGDWKWERATVWTHIWSKGVILGVIEQGFRIEDLHRWQCPWLMMRLTSCKLINFQLSIPLQSKAEETEYNMIIFWHVSLVVLPVPNFNSVWFFDGLFMIRRDQSELFYLLSNSHCKFFLWKKLAEQEMTTEKSQCVGPEMPTRWKNERNAEKEEITRVKL